jgi:hypothetical protein
VLNASRIRIALAASQFVITAAVSSALVRREARDRRLFVWIKHAALHAPAIRIAAAAHRHATIINASHAPAIRIAVPRSHIARILHASNVHRIRIVRFPVLNAIHPQTNANAKQTIYKPHQAMALSLAAGHLKILNAIQIQIVQIDIETRHATTIPVYVLMDMYKAPLLNLKVLWAV